MNVTYPLKSLRERAARMGGTYLADVLRNATVDEEAGTYTLPRDEYQRLRAKYRGEPTPDPERDRQIDQQGGCGCSPPVPE